jgi:hypothetical protein
MKKGEGDGLVQLFYKIACGRHGIVLLLEWRRWLGGWDVVDLVRVRLSLHGSHFGSLYMYIISRI